MADKTNHVKTILSIEKKTLSSEGGSHDKVVKAIKEAMRANKDFDKAQEGSILIIKAHSKAIGDFIAKVKKVGETKFKIQGVSSSIDYAKQAAAQQKITDTVTKNAIAANASQVKLTQQRKDIAEKAAYSEIAAATKAAAAVVAAEASKRAASRKTAGLVQSNARRRLSLITKKIMAMKREVDASRRLLLMEAKRDARLKQSGVITKRFGSITQSAVQKAILSWQSFERVLLVHVIRRAFHQLLFILRQSITRIQDFHKAIVEIRTISQSMPGTFNQWADSLQRVSDHWGVDLIDAANARYQILSNQIAKGTHATELFSEATFAFAKVTKSTAEEAVNVLTAAMNAYGYSSAEVTRISSILFKTVEFGRLRITEIADTLGRAAVPAAQLGISLEELGASIAMITIRGVKSTEAMTLLRGVITKLNKPTNEMLDLLDKWGVASGEAAIATFGWAETLRMLYEETKGSSSEIAELFGRIRPAMGISALLADIEGFQKVLSEFGDKAVGDYLSALDDQFKSTGERAQLAFNQVKNFVEVGLGQSATSALLSVTDAFATTETAIDGTTKEISGLLNVVQGLTKYAIGLGIVLGGKLLSHLFLASGAVATFKLRLALISLELRTVTPLMAAFGLGTAKVASTWVRFGMVVSAVRATLVSTMLSLAPLAAIMTAAWAVSAIIEHRKEIKKADDALTDLANKYKKVKEQAKLIERLKIEVEATDVDKAKEDIQKALLGFSDFRKNFNLGPIIDLAIADISRLNTEIPIIGLDGLIGQTKAKLQELSTLWADSEIGPSQKLELMEKAFKDLEKTNSSILSGIALHGKSVASTLSEVYSKLTKDIDDITGKIKDSQDLMDDITEYTSDTLLKLNLRGRKPEEEVTILETDKAAKYKAFLGAEDGTDQAEKYKEYISALNDVLDAKVDLLDIDRKTNEETKKRNADTAFKDELAAVKARNAQRKRDAQRNQRGKEKVDYYIEPLPTKSQYTTPKKTEKDLKAIRALADAAKIEVLAAQAIVAEGQAEFQAQQNVLLDAANESVKKLEVVRQKLLVIAKQSGVLIQKALLKTFEALDFGNVESEVDRLIKILESASDVDAAALKIIDDQQVDNATKLGTGMTDMLETLTKIYPKAQQVYTTIAKGQEAVLKTQRMFDSTMSSATSDIALQQEQRGAAIKDMNDALEALSGRADVFNKGSGFYSTFGEAQIAAEPVNKIRKQIADVAVELNKLQDDSLSPDAYQKILDVVNQLNKELIHTYNQIIQSTVEQGKIFSGDFVADVTSQLDRYITAQTALNEVQKSIAGQKNLEAGIEKYSATIEIIKNAADAYKSVMIEVNALLSNTSLTMEQINTELMRLSAVADKINAQTKTVGTQVQETPKPSVEDPKPVSNSSTGMLGAPGAIGMLQRLIMETAVASIPQTNPISTLTDESNWPNLRKPATEPITGGFLKGLKELTKGKEISAPELSLDEAVAALRESNQRNMSNNLNLQGADEGGIFKKLAVDLFTTLHTVLKSGENEPVYFKDPYSMSDYAWTEGEDRGPRVSDKDQRAIDSIRNEMTQTVQYKYPKPDVANPEPLQQALEEVAVAVVENTEQIKYFGGVSPTGTQPEFTTRMSADSQTIKNADGSVSSHRMASARIDQGEIAYPTIVNIDGKLVEKSMEEAFAHAIATGGYLIFDTEKQAQDFAHGSWKPDEWSKPRERPETDRDRRNKQYEDADRKTRAEMRKIEHERLRIAQEAERQTKQAERGVTERARNPRERNPQSRHPDETQQQFIQRMMGGQPQMPTPQMPIPGMPDGGTVPEGGAQPIDVTGATAAIDAIQDRIVTLTDTLNDFFAAMSEEAFASFFENMSKAIESLDNFSVSLETITKHASAGHKKLNSLNVDMVYFFNNVVDLEKKIQALNQTMASGGGGSTALATGGNVPRAVYAATGMMTPRGTDTVPAMLTPGEFVMNKSATNRFLQQLVPMNYGQNMNRFTQSGDSVSVGEVNVNVHGGGTPRQTAMEIGTELRRELRRGRLKW